MVAYSSGEWPRKKDGATLKFVGRELPRTLTISPTFPNVGEWNQIAAQQLTVRGTASIVLARHNV